MNEKHQIKLMKSRIQHLETNKEKAQYIVRVFGGDPRMSNDAIMAVLDELLNLKLEKKVNDGSKKIKHRPVLRGPKKD